MDLSTVLALASAVIAAIEQINNIHKAAMSGQISGTDAINQIAALQASLTSQEATNKAAALAAEAARFPGV